jgi:Gene product 88
VKLLGIANTKTMKGEKYGYQTYIMHLAPSTLSGYQVCPMASPGCASACLNLSGMGKFSNVQAARIAKTKWFFEDRKAFMAQLVKEVEAAIRKSTRLGFTPAFRLNGTSDIRWEQYAVVRNGVEYRNVMEAFPTTQFYDYTKLTNRNYVPSNYHLTFSRSETNYMETVRMMAQMNVAVVFDEIPDKYMGITVVDGTETDLRFLDPSFVIVGLKANGKAKKDQTGFTVLTRAA